MKQPRFAISAVALSTSSDWSPRPDTAASGRGGALVADRRRLIMGIWPRSITIWMVGFYVALFIIRPWERLLPGLAEIRFERVYAVSMLLAVTLDGWRLRFDRQMMSVLGFFAVISLSCLTAWQVKLAVEPFYKYATLLVFYFVLLSVVRNAYALVFLVTCYLVAMGLYLSKTAWEFVFNGMYHYTMGVVRMIGIEYTFGGPNDLATSIVLSMPMLLFLFSVRRDFTATWPAMYRWLLGWAMAGYLVLALGCLVATNSRAGMVSFIMFVSLVVLRRRGLMRKALACVAGLVLLGVVWMAMPEESKNRLRTVWDPDSGPESAQLSAMGRVEGFRAGMVMFRRSPLLGMGPGNFIEYRTTYIDGVSLDPHNLLGQALGETGILGTLAFATMVGFTLVTCGRTIRLAEGTDNVTVQTMGRLAMACRETVAILAFDGLFGHNLLRFSWLWAAAFSSLALREALLAAGHRREQMTPAVLPGALPGMR